MIDEWLREVEQIAITAVANGTRVLGLTSPQPSSGVTTISRMLAEIFARSGTRTLLVDLSQTIEVGELQLGEENLWRRIIQNEGNFHILLATPTQATKFQFNNVSWLRNSVRRELAEYRVIVLDLPPLMSNGADLLNPVAAAAACEAVLLVCARGRLTQRQVRTAVNLLRQAQVNLTRTILNNIDYTSAGEEIGRAARSFSKVAPRLSNWIERRALNSELLR